MTNAYFCLSGVATYNKHPDFADLDKVPHELRTMRRALTSLGLRELFEFEDDERSHNDLHTELFNWASTSSSGSDETLVIYCTGHGSAKTPFELVTAHGPYVQPGWLLDAVNRRADLRQIVLIVDACYSQGGIEDAAQAMIRTGSTNANKEFWTIASSRRREQAKQSKFADAFATWLAQHSTPSWETSHFEPSVMVPAINDKLGTTQVARQLAGIERGCHALPNPRYQPPKPPDARELPILGLWAAHARGVANASEPGFFFTGRSAALTTIREHATGETPETLLVTGAPQTGKSALLGHFMITTAAPQALPAEQRLAWPALNVRTAAAGGTRTAVMGRLAEAFGADGRDVDAIATAVRAIDSPVTVVLDQLEEKDDWTDLLTELTNAPSVRLVIGVSNDTTVEVPGATRVLDLDQLSRHPDQDVYDYLVRRLALSEPPVLGSEAAKLAARWGISFAIAVAAVTAYQAKESRSTNPRARGDRRAAEMAQRLCAEVLTAQFDGDTADLLVKSLWGLCSYDESVALPTHTWAAVAAPPDGKPVDVDALAACAARLRPLIESMPAQDGGARWRPTLCFDTEDDERARTAGLSTRSSFLARLPELATRNQLGWEAVDPAVRVLIATGAALPTPRGRLIDQPDFLLDAPPAVVQLAVRRLQEHGELARRSRIMRVLTAKVPRDDRTLLLEIAARRFEVPPLVGKVDRAPEVGWVQPDRPHLERLTQLAAHRGSVVVTVNAQDVLEFFQVTNGAPSRTSVRLSGVPKSLSAATVDGEDVVLVTTTRGELWLVPCGRDDVPERLPIGIRPDSAELHDSGLMLLVLRNQVWSAPLRAPRAELIATMDTDLRSTHLTGPLDQPICWCVSVSGRVRRLQLHDRIDVDVATFPLRKPLRRTAASPDGQRLLAVDTTDALHLRSANKEPDLPHGQIVRGVRAADLDERVAVIGCHSREVGGKLIRFDLTEGEVPTEVLLDDEPIWVALTSSSRVLVARPSGLLSLTPPTSDRPDERESR